MIQPGEGDYIDIHVHDGKPADGNFIVESLMAHEDKMPGEVPGMAYTFGIHPWFLSPENSGQHLEVVEKMAGLPSVIAIGEAGFDKLRGPSLDLQDEVFGAQVKISESHKKPLIIHSVRAWDELLHAHKNLKPAMNWMIHGFRGKTKLAQQLISKGFYLSFWFEFALRPESSEVFRNIPSDRFFLETDGADVDIREIYKKVSADLGISVSDLKAHILSNYNDFFNIH